MHNGTYPIFRAPMGYVPLCRTRGRKGVCGQPSVHPRHRVHRRLLQMQTGTQRGTHGHTASITWYTEGTQRGPHGGNRESLKQHMEGTQRGQNREAHLQAAAGVTSPGGHVARAGGGIEPVGGLDGRPFDGVPVEEGAHVLPVEHTHGRVILEPAASPRHTDGTHHW